MSAANSPRIEHVLADVLRSAAGGARTGMPGRVERVDLAKGEIDVQPLVLRGYFDEAEERATERLPVATHIPLVTFGGGGYRVAVPVAKGDTVWLAFSQCSLDRWLARGGEVDPEFDQPDRFADAVAFPGVRDFAHPWSIPSDRMSLGRDDGAARLDITAAEVLVGGGASASHERLLKADTFIAAFQELIGNMTTAIGTSGTPAGATAAAGAITAYYTDVFLPALSAAYTTVAKAR